MDKIPVIIDTSEDPKIREMFLNDPDFEVVIDDLPTGDYIIGNIAIERKEGDFLSSLGGDKLKRQLTELKTNFPRCMLVIIGSLADKIKWSDNPKVPPKRYMSWMLGSITTYSLDMGIPVVMVADREEFRELMKHVAKHAKEIVRHGPAAEAPEIATTQTAMVTFKKRDRDQRGVQRDMLRALAGISAKKANEMLDRYGSPVEVAIAAQNGTLRKEMDGIGPKTAQAIVEAFLIRT